MKKQMIKNATMLLALLVCGTAFVACGGDDDDNNGGYNGGQTRAIIKSI